MSSVSAELLQKLQHKRNQIRNICIVAHVDHGKTTLADSLIASNGIISASLAGQVRYLDFNKEEMARMITMKACAIALMYRSSSSSSGNGAAGSTAYLVNLVDSPGHADFIGEVEAAVRVLDGCLVVVDAVEGVCIQTHAVLRQAWSMQLKAILVLNKIDRLVTQLHMTPLDAYEHLKKVVQAVNAVQATFLQHDAMARADASAAQHVDISDADEARSYFSPANGNVIFASGLHRWGFRIEQFADYGAAKLGMKRDALLKVLWGDFYFDAKSRKVTSKATSGAQLPFFVQMCLKSIWGVYAADGDAARLRQIAEQLGVVPSLTAPAEAQALLRDWLPLADTVLANVVEHLPSPIDSQRQRGAALFDPDAMHDAALATTIRSVISCDAGPDAPLLVYVSKVFPVGVDSLPRQKIEVKRRAYVSKAEREAMAAAAAAGAQGVPLPEREPAPTAAAADADGAEPSSGAVQVAPPPDENDSKLFICLARVLSGTLRPGMQVRVLGPKHNDLRAPETGEEGAPAPAPVATIAALYVMMGQNLEALSEAPAGCVVGIGGLQEHVLKTALLTDADRRAPPLASHLGHTVGMLRVAIEPTRAQDYKALTRGLALLESADAAVDVEVQQTGEIVLSCAGELHLSRCLSDLRDRYAKKIAFTASAPIVPMRESILNVARRRSTVVVQHTQNRLFAVVVDCVRVPDAVAQCVEQHEPILRRLFLPTARRTLVGDVRRAAAAAALAALTGALDGAGWGALRERVWAFGPRHVSSCLLVNGVDWLPADDVTALSAVRLLQRAAELSDVDEALVGKLPRLGDGDEAAPAPVALADDAATRALVDALMRLGAEPPKPEDGGGDEDAAPVYLDDDESSEEIDEGDKWWRELPLVDSGTRVRVVRELHASICAGFQLATAAGPLCDEPLHRVAFFVRDVRAMQAPAELASAGATDKYGSVAGQMAAATRTACRLAFLARSPRIVEPMYLCDIQAPGDVLGKVYGLLNSCRAVVQSEQLKQGTPLFHIRAHLPVVTSFGVAEAMSKRTSGAASVQLIFSHFSTVPADPFFDQNLATAAQLAVHDSGTDALPPDTARQLCDSVRRRKGLFVAEQLVQDADKQRTRARKK
jgi:ribosome assembly protein 1